MLNPLTIALFATVAGVANAQCNRDNCLRAVIASAFPTRSGSADCDSYFRTTVTPATVTYTATLSQTESTTTSGTALEVTTTTEVLPVTVVEPTTITVVETDFATVVINAKRLQPESPFQKQIPAYASACSGAVRYSSACSCLGATQSTVIAAAPSTTITVTVVGTETFTYSTTTTSTAVETDFSTITNTQIITIPTTTIATTTIIHTRPPYQKCLGPFNTLGSGGCSANCYCDELQGASQGFCNAATVCGISCQTDLDCPDYSACTSGHPECNGANVCLDFSSCLTLNVPKRFAMRESAENKRNGILIRPTN